MASSVDPCEVLGVGRDASMEEIRLAYRAAALKYHPDNCPGDPVEVQRRFSEIAEAYRALCRAARQGRQGRRFRRVFQTFEPQDFTRLEVGWHTGRADDADTPDCPPWRDLPGRHKISLARLNEPRAFALLWVLSVVLALAATYVVARLRVRGGFREDMHPAEALILLALPLGIYAALTTASLAALVLTRKIVWLVGQLGYLARRTLPAPRKDQELPPAPRVSKLPEAGEQK